MSYKDEILKVLLYEKNENSNGGSCNQLKREEELNGIKSLLSDKNGNFIENYLQYVLVSMS